MAHDKATADSPSSSAPTPRAAVAELLQKADKLIDAQDLEAAEDLLLQVLDMERTAPVLVMVGRVILGMEGPQAALPVFTEAVQQDPANQDAHLYMANVYFQMGDERCVWHTAKTVELAPQTHHYKENFLSCLNTFAERIALQPHGKTIFNAINTCLETPHLELQALKHIWLPILNVDPLYSRFYRCFPSQRPDGKPSFFEKVKISFSGGTGELYVVFDEAHFDQQKDLSPLCTPFFLNGLRQLQIGHVGFENFLTALRKRLLHNRPPSIDAKTHLDLSSALAVYCAETEYVFNTTAAEDAEISKLRTHIENTEKTSDLANDIAIYACYAPLHLLRNADPILEVFGNHPVLKQIVNADIHLHKKLQDKAAVLSAMSGFDNEISMRVREQYEQFPYPRWKHRPNAVYEEADKPLREEGARILVAGCGTGREAANTALKFPRAFVDAIDLSTASLSYAMMKAEEFNIQNVRFRHGDILHLDFPDAYFDAISCHGVLHHMEDPAAGWKSLLRCLKPDGLMRIGLYSELARRDFVAAQRIIAEKKIPGTTEAMKDFRKRAADILPYPVYTALITKSQDYYQLSPLRDLLFHEQEHRMTLPRLQKMMDDLGLELISFAVNRPYRIAYEKLFGNAPDTLENWHKFEEMNPDTFSGMYQFWCRRKNTAPVV